MSQKPEDETYSIMFAALKHPIRRKILRMLSNTQLSYTQLLKGLDLDTGHMNYYLESLGELVLKSEDGNYRLSQTGQAAIALMEKVEDRTTQEKEIAWLKQQKKQKRRSIIILQAFAIIVFLATILVFFNVAYVSSGPLEVSHKNPPDYIIQPDEIIEQVDFINTQHFRQNTSTVNWQYIYKLDITTNSTLWVQVIGGVVDNEVKSLENIRSESTLLYNDTISGPIGSSSAIRYELLIPLPDRDIELNDGYNNGFLVQVRIANLGQQTLNEGVLHGTLGEFELIQTKFLIKTEYPYFYYGVVFLVLIPITIVLPYFSDLKKVVTHKIDKIT
jgi:DNA-binding transcriptional ArsR family regulator